MSDRQRDKEIYKYLFNLMLERKSEDASQSINFSQTSQRLGYGKKSEFAIRIYDFINDNSGGKYGLPASLSLESLVERIVAIKETLEVDYRQNVSESNVPNIFRKEDIILLCSYFSRLTLKEREDLGLTKSQAEIILQQALLNISRYHNEQDQETILQLYKSSLGLTSDHTFAVEIQMEADRNELIEKTVKNYFDQYLGLSQWRNNVRKQKELIARVKRHITRLESQAGIGELESLTRSKQYTKDFKKIYLNDNFVNRLIKSTIENHIIRESLPIYFQYVEIAHQPPLPLYYNSPEGLKGLLNHQIIQPDTTPDNSNLASLYAYKVTVSFNLKLKDRYSKILDKIKDKFTNIPDIQARLLEEEKDGIVFTVNSYGVGGQLSQIIKVINRALLWDIKCLRKEYFSVAHEVIINQDLYKNSIASPVLAHSLVQLCRIETLKQALLENKSYTECSHIDEIAVGDYCGFNYLESMAKSALLARLSAILKTQINPEEYIQDLTIKVIQREVMRVANDYLFYYPFSLNAMENYLEKNLNLGKTNSEELCYIQYEAYLIIIRAYLREGLYRKADKYLRKIEDLEKFSQNQKNREEIFSGALLVQYEICKANYFYLFDSDDDDEQYRWKGLVRYDREELITQAWKSLKKAEDHLKIRHQKYVAIGEVSQSIFSPYFDCLARINFFRAKVCLYFPEHTALLFENYQFTHNIDFDNNYNYARIYFLERARIYHAKNGDTLSYSCDTAYQVFVYLVIGYLVNDRIKVMNKEVNFTRENCLDWARRLLNNSLTCYSKFGRKCYYQVKEKSGVVDCESGSKKNDNCKKYGDCLIETIPLIREIEIRQLKEEREKQGYKGKDNILWLDMSLLNIKKIENKDLDEHIYLFGAKSAIILFAKGMYELCNDIDIDSEEKWIDKLYRAYRLLNYAWGVGEDGCQTEEIKNTKNNDIKITRPHFDRDNPDRIDPNLPIEVRCIRDMYPHRQSEIADLGKVFAIASALMLLYLVKQNKIEKQRLETEIGALIEGFHGDETRLQRDRAQKKIEGQKEFNGHLRDYLDFIKIEVQKEKTKIENEKLIPDRIGMKKIRQKILEKFFQGFYNKKSRPLS